LFGYRKRRSEERLIRMRKENKWLRAVMKRIKLSVR
jgi:hypothetical protein